MAFPNDLDWAKPMMDLHNAGMIRMARRIKKWASNWKVENSMGSCYTCPSEQGHIINDSTGKVLCSQCFIERVIRMCDRFI